MSPIPRARRRGIWVLLFVCVAGCGKPEPVDDVLRALDPAYLVPVSGVVTVGGKPLAKVVVTFLPPSGAALAAAETETDGKYELKSAGGKGALPGEYRVAISYMLSDKGEPQGMAARTSMIQRPGMLTARERLPAEYADLGRSKITAEVGPKGGIFNYDVPTLLPEVATETTPPKTAEGGKPAEKEPEDGKPYGNK